MCNCIKERDRHVFKREGGGDEIDLRCWEKKAKVYARKAEERKGRGEKGGHIERKRRQKKKDMRLIN